MILFIITRIFAQIVVGFSVVWLCNGGGIWFLIPWTIGWSIYHHTFSYELV